MEGAIFSLFFLFKVLNSGCLTLPATKKMLHIARGIVTHFKHSVTSMKLLHNAQKSLGAKEKSLIQDEPTRWDSTYYMLQRLLEQKDAIFGKRFIIKNYFI